MKRISYFCFILFFCWFIPDVIGQNQITIYGYVKEKISEEVLSGISIMDSLSQQGTFSDENGFYQLHLPQNRVHLVASGIGYQTSRWKSNILQDTTLHFELHLDTVALQTVTVSAARSENPENTPILGKIRLTAQQISSLPSIGGEKDVIKALALLPGTSGGREGQNTLLVRGGGTDQTLVLLDGVPMFNTGHLLNFMSIFNTDAVKNIDYYRSGFPTQYGGRLSGIVDIHTRDGNKNRWQGKAEVGLISTKILAEGPLNQSKKTTLLFSGRSSYLDLFSLGKKKEVFLYLNNSFFKYRFFDIHTKLSHAFEDGSKLSVNAFYTYDQLNLGDGIKSEIIGTISETNVKVQNFVGVLNYQKSLSPQLFFKTTLFATGRPDHRLNLTESYRLQDDDELGTYGIIFPVTTLEKIGFEYINENYTVYNQGIHLHFNWSPSAGHAIKMGFWGQHNIYPVYDFAYQFQPDFSPHQIEVLYVKAPTLKALEGAWYVEDNLVLGQWAAQLGLRWSSFFANQHFYQGLSPRLNIKYTFPKLFTLKAGYTHTQQYNHLLLTNDLLIAETVWIPSTPFTPPAIAHQYSMEISRYLKTWNIEVSMGAYYKNMKNLVQYPTVEVVDPYKYDNWQEKVFTNGLGKAYGLEWYIARSLGRLTGLGSYTLSWNKRRFPDLANGQFFPARFDNRHAISLALQYQFNKKWQVSSSWSFHNGDRFTLPNALVTSNPFTSTYTINAGLNANQLPNFHRLDFSLTYQKSLPKSNLLTIRLDVYNVYNRANTFYLKADKNVRYDENWNIIDEENVIKSVSLFPVIPSVSLAYNW